MEAPAGYEMGMRNPIKGVTMRTTMVVLAVAGLWLAASRAHAQSGQRRGGLWVEAGLGHGTMNVSCDSVCFGGPRTGGTAGFVEVAAVDQHFRMGGALHVWWHSGSPDFTSSASASQRLTNIGAVLHYYPAAGGAGGGGGGFFLGGGLGLSNYHSTSADAFSNAWGWGFTADAGYDIALRSRVSLTPRLTYAYGNLGTVHNTGAHPFSLTGWKQNVVDLGVGLTYR